MACNLNLNAAARYIHWAPPGDLDGLHQLAKAKVEELGLSVGRRSHVTPENVAGDPSVNVRGIIHFINGVEAIAEGDSDAQKKAKQEQHGQLVALYATLQARCAAAGYKPPEAEKAAPAPPLPAPTPDPKPLA